MSDVDDEYNNLYWFCRSHFSCNRTNQLEEAEPRERETKGGCWPADWQSSCTLKGSISAHLDVLKLKLARSKYMPSLNCVCENWILKNFGLQWKKAQIAVFYLHWQQLIEWCQIILFFIDLRESPGSKIDPRGAAPSGFEPAPTGVELG